MFKRTGALFLLISGVLLLVAIGCNSQEDHSAVALKFGQPFFVHQGHLLVVPDSLTGETYSGHALRGDDILAMDFFKQLSFEERIAVRGLPVFVMVEGELLLVGMVGERINTNDKENVVLEFIPFRKMEEFLKKAA